MPANDEACRDVEKEVRKTARESLHEYKALQGVLERAGAEAQIPFPPHDMRTVLEVEARSVTFRFPVCGFSLRDMVILVVVAAVFVCVPFLLMTLGYEGGVHQELWLGAALVSAAGLGVRAWALATRRVTVTVSAGALSWVREGPLFRASRDVGREDIDEIALPEPPGDQLRTTRGTAMRFPVRPWHELPGITVRATGESLEFGRNLAYVELRWIHAVVSALLGKAAS